MDEIEYLKSRGVELKEPQTLTWEEGIKILNEMGEVIPVIDEVLIEPIQDEEFDLYTSEFILCDSTFIFLYDSIANAVAKIKAGATYDTIKYSKEQILKAKKVCYKVGKIVIDEYLDETAKGFRNYAYNTFIPYKMEIIE